MLENLWNYLNWLTISNIKTDLNNSCVYPHLLSSIFSLSLSPLSFYEDSCSHVKKGTNYSQVCVNFCRSSSFTTTSSNQNIQRMNSALANTVFPSVLLPTLLEGCPVWDAFLCGFLWCFHFPLHPQEQA